MPGTRKRRHEYRRHVPNGQRGATFATKAAFVDAIRRQAEKEFVEARSRSALEAFRREYRALDTWFDVEERSCRVLLAFLQRYESAVDIGQENAKNLKSIPQGMICSRVLVQFAPELQALFDTTLVETMRRAVTDPDYDTGWQRSHPPSAWGSMVAYLSWWKRPVHRRVVLMALERCGALGPRRGFRTLAAASLLAGGATITFKPGVTTPALAIEMESKRMRTVALRENTSWAVPRDVDGADASEEVHSKQEPEESDAA